MKKDPKLMHALVAAIKAKRDEAAEDPKEEAAESPAEEALEDQGEQNPPQTHIHIHLHPSELVPALARRGLKKK